ncbi:SIP domain-containing protein [Streptomyces xiamenensis]|uniref:SIP domain-containing protein n=1 Tax=Streptomyces xiamenensis TaxID=408015 RepID=UPI0036AF5910
MARKPTFFADYAERRGFVTRVDAVGLVGEGLLRIGGAGEGLRAAESGPCDVAAFRVAARDFQACAPEALNPAAGRATVLLHRHGQQEALGLAKAEAVGTVARLAPDAAYLAGHGQSVQVQRDLLRTVRGLDRRTIRTQPYWATGRAGL